jgi:HlyD family secretion protein
MRRKTVGLLILLGLALGAVGVYAFYRPTVPPQIQTAKIVEGDVVEAVGATGTLEAVTTVQVGTQVSGTVSALYADYNSIVHKGQVIARLDPSLFQTQIEQAKANLLKSKADVERLRVSLMDAQVKGKRAEDLARTSLIAQQDLDSARVAIQAAEAELRSSQAQVTQAQAALNQNQVNLDHAIITAPIDGIVIARSVDVGQTVAASMQAPTLFVLAADLTKMRVNTNVDEADVGRIRPDQLARFRVDAFPTEEFIGKVSQIRLQPVVQQNVVTYSTVVEVANPQYKLKPGMTATISIEIARREHVLRVPNAALRFRPTEDMFLALNQPVPPELNRAGGDGTNAQRGAGGGGGGQGAGGGQGGGRRNRGGANAAAGAPSGGASATNVANGGAAANSTNGAAGTDGNATNGGSATSGAKAAAANAMNAQGKAGQTKADGKPGASMKTASTIDALFGALPEQESGGRVWLIDEGQQLKMARLRLGISDGSFTEIRGGGVTANADAVTAIVLPASTQTRAAGGGGNGNPLLGNQQRPGQQGRNPPAGGRGGR